MPPLVQTEVRPYQIAVEDEKLTDLRDRLCRAALPDELDGAGWDLGAPLPDVSQILTYWRDTYDWRAAEARLNREFPQFVTSVAVDGFDPIDIHFVHQRCTAAPEQAIPLVFVHGWPGSFYEGTKIVHPLSEGGPGDDVPGFHVVVPSLPNFGFSQGPNKLGFSIQHHAEALHKLMLRLGYTEYATQGGDWGWFITRAMAVRYPSHVRASHYNMDQGSPPSFTAHPRLAIEHALTPYSADEKRGFARTQWFGAHGSGYYKIQSTKPQTMGYALRDSPVALLAWVYEKLHDWTDAYPWTHDEICTWISIYWFSTAGPQASVRRYYEFRQNSAPKAGAERRTFSHKELAKPLKDNRVKIGLSHFPRDLCVLPSSWTRTQGDVVYEKRHPSGGHFPAWERPEAIVADLRAMFRKGGGATKGFRNTKL
ncbi:microsomal epoxide hydrolase [Microdochium trichocladiopsis]|uniref:Microsomal epoxide hydrolase n=1 Tax=Microdochium trichocladiopsis TaxID=1682393 RepID=A0A9P8Y6D9_9PEZI|nr:microsomal epoxide hydrolase [Microdochium trichocladiopsis]KAH7030763.1 microsomal epoxide hydrolase [Microdochium trichocladiopsis]